MDALSGAWFSLKLIGGRYSAMRPCLWSFRSIVSSVTSTALILQRPGWSCRVECRRWALTSSRLDRNNLTSPPTTTGTEKALLLILCCRGGVFWSECLMVSKTSQSQGCEPRAEWSLPTHCQNIHSSTPMYPRALKLLTGAARKTARDVFTAPNVENFTADVYSAEHSWTERFERTKPLRLISINRSFIDGCVFLLRSVSLKQLIWMQGEFPALCSMGRQTCWWAFDLVVWTEVWQIPPKHQFCH